MFALNISQNGKDFKSYFQNHRLRRYADLQRAVNASKQLFNNPKNNLKAIKIYKVSDNSEVAFLEKNEGEITYAKIEEHKEDLVKRKGNLLPIDSLVDRPMNLNSTDDRIAFLKECHKVHREKKKEATNDKLCSGSVNNLSSEGFKKQSSHFSSFNSRIIKEAIQINDFKTLFSIELTLSKNGYSWYPDDNNDIHVLPTREVLDLLSKKTHGL